MHLFTLAFPSVGCGKLGCDPATVAKHMIDETRTQLLAYKGAMTVSFVLLASQQDVYDRFVQYLNNIPIVDGTATRKPHRRPDGTQQRAMQWMDKGTMIAVEYPLSVDHSLRLFVLVVEITLTSSNKNHLVKCKSDITELAESASTISELKDKKDMNDWSQNTVEKFCQRCLEIHVRPTLDFDQLSVRLEGPKHAVSARHASVRYRIESF